MGIPGRPMKGGTRFIARLWFYFRTGYSTYLTFLLGYASTLVTVYYLAIKNIPDLLNIFPHFVPFAVLATVIGVPMSIAIGWTHIKRSPAWTAELDVGVEANPYNYKLPPGYYKEAWTPVYLELLMELRKIAVAQNLVDREDLARMDDLERKLKTLISGGCLGTPRRRM